MASACVAGPPFITDDPEPVELHHYELYLGGAVYSKNAAGESLNSPFVEFNYGALPDTQLHLVINGAYNRATGGGKAHYGLGDTELGIKYRVLHESDWLPQVGVFPLLELSTGDHHQGLGNGQSEIFLPVWAQKSWGEWTAYGGGGFFYNPAPGGRNFWRFGAVVQRDFTKQFTLGVEVFHETPTAPDVGGHTAFNAGMYYNFNDNEHLLLSAGRDIDGPNLFMTYLALQLTW